MKIYMITNNGFHIIKFKKLAALLLGCFFLCACENDEREVDSLTKKTLGVEEAKDIIMTFTTGGKTKAVLTSPLMLRVQESSAYTEFPNSIFVDFYNDQMVIESNLKAKYAKYKENEQVVFLRDSVRVINVEKGDTLYCKELYWDRSRIGTEFYTDKAVRIRTKTQVMDGIGMEASQDFKTYHIINPAGILSVPNDQFPQ